MFIDAGIRESPHYKGLLMIFGSSHLVQDSSAGSSLKAVNLVHFGNFLSLGGSLGVPMLEA